jgi:hypothetical protein
VRSPRRFLENRDADTYKSQPYNELRVGERFA